MSVARISCLQFFDPSLRTAQHLAHIHPGTCGEEDEADHGHAWGYWQDPKTRRDDALEEEQFDSRGRKGMNVDALREAIEAQDKRRYAALLAEDVRFLSPLEAEPSVGREAASIVLSTVFEDFRYVDQLDGEDLHLLVFQARVGDIPAGGRRHPNAAIRGAHAATPGTCGRTHALTGPLVQCSERGWPHFLSRLLRLPALQRPLSDLRVGLHDACGGPHPRALRAGGCGGERPGRALCRPPRTPGCGRTGCGRIRGRRSLVCLRGQTRTRAPLRVSPRRRTRRLGHWADAASSDRRGRRPTRSRTVRRG